MSREALIISTIASSLEWDETRPRQVDRVAAIGMANDPLGAFILHAMAGDMKAATDAVSIVSRAIRPHCRNISAARVAAAVLADLIDQRCKPCGGRGVVYSSGVPSTCKSCQGSKLADTRKIKRKVGGKAIPDDLYSKTYIHFSNSLNNISFKARLSLQGVDD